MEDVELLKEVKLRLGVTGSYHNYLLAGYIEDVKAYMLSAGVKPRVLNGTSSIGCIARGVADLWNCGAGEGKFSEVFMQRLIQLSLPDSGMEDGCEDFDPIPEGEIDNIVGEIVIEPELDYELVTREEIDEVAGSIPEPERPDYATSDDVDDVIDGSYQKPAEPDNPELDEDEYEEFTKEEIDAVL